MTKKITLEILAAQMQKGFGSVDLKFSALEERIEKGFGAIADDIADLRRELKGDIVAVAHQVNAIETDLRGMKRDKLVIRVADLEDEVFGKTRA